MVLVMHISNCVYVQTFVLFECVHFTAIKNIESRCFDGCLHLPSVSSLICMICRFCSIFLNDGQILVVKDALFRFSFQYFKVNELWEHKNSERLAAIIIDIYMYVLYVYGDYSQTNEILSYMETKLFLVLHVDHKPLNIKTTQLNRLRNVKAIVLFIQLHSSSTVHCMLFTGFPSPILRRRPHVAATG